MKVTEFLKLSDSEIKEYIKQNNGNLCLTHFYYTFWDEPYKVLWWNGSDEVRIIKRFPIIHFLFNEDFSEGNPYTFTTEIIVKGVKKLRLRIDGPNVIELKRYVRP